MVSISHSFIFSFLIHEKGLKSLSNLIDKNSEEKNKNKKFLIYLISLYPILILVAIMIFGHHFRINSITFVNLEDIITTIDQNSILKLGVGLVGGIGLTLFVDHFIWRFNNPEEDHGSRIGLILFLKNT